MDETRALLEDGLTGEGLKDELLFQQTTSRSLFGVRPIATRMRCLISCKKQIPNSQFTIMPSWHIAVQDAGRCRLKHISISSIFHVSRHYFRLRTADQSPRICQSHRANREARVCARYLYCQLCVRSSTADAAAVHAPTFQLGICDSPISRYPA